MSLILKDGFRFQHIQFGKMFKFKFPALFPVDHLSYPDVLIFILLVYQFQASAL